MAPEDTCKTAIATPLGNNEFLRMSMGLRTASQTFLPFLHNVLKDLPFCSVFIDDIIIVFSMSMLKHKDHLNADFCRLCENSLIVNLSATLASQK